MVKVDCFGLLAEWFYDDSLAVERYVWVGKSAGEGWAVPTNVDF